MPELTVNSAKKEQRATFLQLRSAISPELRHQMDAQIAARMLRSTAFAQADTILAFVSTPQEVDTHDIIRKALRQNKGVAVPFCIPNTRRMEFRHIQNFSKDLRSGAYGILEPILENCPPAVSTNKTLCLVPGLAFDCHGMRLGYGGGYYDRFLVDFPGITAGLVYEQFLVGQLPSDLFDIACQLVITEKREHKIT